MLSSASPTSAVLTRTFFSAFSLLTGFMFRYNFLVNNKIKRLPSQKELIQTTQASQTERDRDSKQTWQSAKESRHELHAPLNYGSHQPRINEAESQKSIGAIKVTPENLDSTGPQKENLLHFLYRPLFWCATHTNLPSCLLPHGKNRHLYWNNNIRQCVPTSRKNTPVKRTRNPALYHERQNKSTCKKYSSPVSHKKAQSQTYWRKKCDEQARLIRRLLLGGYEVNTRCWNNYLKLLRNSKQYSKAEEIYARMKSSIKCDMFTHNIMLTIYGEQGKFNDTKILFQELLAYMQKTNKYNIVTFNTMLMIFAEQGKFKEAIELYNDKIPESIRNIVTHNTRLKICWLQRDLIKAKQLFYTGIPKSIPKNIKTYNTFLKILCDHKQHKEAKLLYAAMRKKRDVRYNNGHRNAPGPHRRRRI